MRESNLQISKRIEDKFQEQVELVTKEKRTREDTTDQFLGEIAEKLGSIEGEIDKEKKWKNDKLVKRLSEEISAFHDVLSEERKRREENQN